MAPDPKRQSGRTGLGIDRARHGSRHGDHDLPRHGVESRRMPSGHGEIDLDRSPHGLRVVRHEPRERRGRGARFHLLVGILCDRGQLRPIHTGKRNQVSATIHDGDVERPTALRRTTLELESYHFHLRLSTEIRDSTINALAHGHLVVP